METGIIISGAALAFGINVVVSLVKKFIYPKFGSFGVHVFSFVLATIGAVYVIYGGQFPALQNLLIAAAALFSTAVSFYEVVLKHLSFFKDEGDTMEEAREERHG